MTAADYSLMIFGAVDLESPPIDFAFTDYYRAEMGSALSRFWISFGPLCSAEELAGMKIVTNRIEEHYCTERGGRRCNIDPGLVSLHSLVLATTKPAAHRIYLRDGIYAEVTLTFHRQTFQPLPWTYPDYRTETAREFFMAVRAKISPCQTGQTRL